MADGGRSILQQHKSDYVTPLRFKVLYSLVIKYTVCPTRYRTRHFFNNFTTNENIATKLFSGLTSSCNKCDDIITCAGSGHHLRPDRIETGAPYSGKSLPVCPLSLPEFLRWCLLSRCLWFVVCFGKLSLSDIPIRNNQAAPGRASPAAKDPSEMTRSPKKD